MSEKFPFQFTMLQYYYDTFTGEFLNVGLAMYSPNPQFFRVKLLTKYARITNTFPTADGEYYRSYISKLQTKFDNLAYRINSKQTTFDPWLPHQLEELLNMILPVDDLSLRFGSVHGGMAQDLDVTFEDLYSRLIEKYLPIERTDSRDDAAVWQIFHRPLQEHNIIHQLRPTTIKTPKDDIDFDHAWKNEHWNALQPLSFDYLYAQNIKKKSHQWFTANVLINKVPEMEKIYYLFGKPQRDDTSIKKAYQKAKDLLGTGEYANKVEIIEEDAADDFAREIAPKIIADVAQEEND